jgi:hypothetical protein
MMQAARSRGDMRSPHGVENCGTRSVIVADARRQSLPSIGNGLAYRVTNGSTPVSARSLWPQRVVVSVTIGRWAAASVPGSQCPRPYFLPELRGGRGTRRQRPSAGNWGWRALA